MDAAVLLVIYNVGKISKRREALVDKKTYAGTSWWVVFTTTMGGRPCTWYRSPVRWM